MIFIYFFCTKIAGTRHVLFVQLHSILKGARRFGFQTKTPPLAANAATAARRTPQEGLRATEVWVPDQTSGAQAPFFGGLLGPTVRSALRAMPPQFASRARGQRQHPFGPSPNG
ncbi:hypothetical protein D7Y41_34065 [Anaerotruncus sp. 1XD22-93]|nr:hypothetical protein [Anaerotruncus sp. 1XD42-93]RKJ74910.1 hypothetical protein D7Y41_34065 [Anaerotruncus sp. 1XD22-93]